MRYGNGFTLIELLVVVLIIGILAAIALPQYEVSVGKTKFNNYVSIGKTVKNAQEMYFLSHGKYASTLQELNISFSDKDCSYRNNNAYMDCKDFTIALYSPSAPYQVEVGTNTLRFVHAFDNSAIDSAVADCGRRRCYAAPAREYLKKVCAAAGGRECRAESASWAYYALD